MYTLSFQYNKKDYSFSNSILIKLLGEVIDWLVDNGYKFTGDLHTAFTRKPITVDEIKSSDKSEIYMKRLRHYHKMKDGRLLYIGGNVEPAFNFIKKMLVKFGVQDSTIKHTESKISKIKPFSEFDDFELDDLTLVDTVSKKMTFIEAAQLILKENDNTPMSANEIWEQIEDLDLVKTKSVNPSHTLNANILAYSDNSNVSKKYKNKLFHVVSTNPAMFILINPENEVQPASEDDEFDLESPTKTSAFTLPEDDVLLGDILPFTHFRGVQSQEEREKVKSTEPIEPVNNPFMQAVCILGISGAGKSYTIDEILEKDSKKRPHEYEFIIPSASTTGLLSQFSPSAKGGSGGYLPSRLGKLIELAYKNPKTLYTAVFDECHKSNVIEMINDELLQAISTGRNKNRFISLDDETAELYPSKVLDIRNNIIIPHNLGFIFISSNARIIAGNEDFFNRVDLVEITKEDRDLIKNINDLDKKRVTDTEKKYDLVSTIMAYTGRKN